MTQQNVLKGETAVSFQHKQYKVLSSTSIAGKINESILFFLTTCIKAQSKNGEGGKDNGRRRLEKQFSVEIELPQYLCQLCLRNKFR